VLVFDSQMVTMVRKAAWESYKQESHFSLFFQRLLQASYLVLHSKMIIDVKFTVTLLIPLRTLALSVFTQEIKGKTIV